MIPLSERRTWPIEKQVEYLRNEIAEVIAGASNPDKLQALQQRCDYIRWRYKNPTVVRQMIESLMWQQLQELQDGLMLLSRPMLRVR